MIPFSRLTHSIYSPPVPVPPSTTPPPPPPHFRPCGVSQRENCLAHCSASSTSSWRPSSECLCVPKKPTRVAAPSPRASLGRRTLCGRTEQRRPPVSNRYETKVRMVWGSFLIAAAALKTPTRNGDNAQGVNLTFLCGSPAERPLPVVGALWRRSVEYVFTYSWDAATRI